MFSFFVLFKDYYPLETPLIFSQKYSAIYFVLLST